MRSGGASVESFDLAEAILDISRIAHRDILGTEPAADKHLDEIARISAECEKRLHGKRGGRAVVKTINNYFFSELGIRADPDEKRIGHLFPGSVLETKSGSCLAVSGLYLAVTQRLELPFYGVLVPGHFFIRYDDGRVRINVETLKKGASIGDRWYRKEYRVPAGSSCYLRNLSPKEVLAPYYFNLGNAYRARGRLDEAADAYKRAVTILPGFAEARGNLGVVYFRMGEMDKAIAKFEAAIEANPLLAGAYLDLGAVYQARGQLLQAAAYYRKGLAVSPRSAELHHALGTVLHAQGRIDEAISAYRTAIRIRPDFPRAREDLARAYSR